MRLECKQRRPKYMAARMASCALAALLVSAVAPEAFAQSLEDMQRQLATLQQQVTDMQAQMAEAEKAEEENLKVSWKGAPELSSADGDFKMKIRGRLLIDGAFIGQDTSVTGDDDVDATEFRAARFGVEGVVMGDVKYTLEADFAGNSVSLADAYLRYQGWPVQITVGQHKTPNSLEEQTSSRYITFMERASITDAFGLARQIGISAKYKTGDFMVMGGVYRGSAGSSDMDEGLTLAARATFGPKIGDKTQLHIGASVRHREIGDDQGMLRYRQRPHQHLADRFVATTRIADSDMLVGLEAAAVFGPFALQGEYMRLSTDTPVTGDVEPSFDGFYVSGSWFLTGESRKYSGGNFSRVSVKSPVNEGGMGAFQLAARFDTIDLSDNPVMGGTQDSYIFGVNWHLNNYMRLMANYNISDIEGGVDDGAKIKGLGVRAQVDW